MGARHSPDLDTCGLASADVFARVSAQADLVLYDLKLMSTPKGYEKWERSKQKTVTDKKSLFYGIHYIYADKKGSACL